MSEKPEYDEDEQAWSEAWSDDKDGDGASPEATPSAEEPDPEAPPAPEDDIASLKHKLRSAEGRLTKFEEHVEDLRKKILSRETPNEPETPEEDTFLPDGWSQEDWEDFSADYPVQAELLEQQSRQVRQLNDRMQTTETHISVSEQNKEFEDTILKAHPDYDDLLANERQQIVDFIEGQPNPTLKSAYQQVYQNGSAEQIIDLVTDYKEHGRQPAGKNEPPVSSSTVNNALAVPGRSRSPSNITGKSGMPDANDFSGSWNYFSDDSIDD
ncbi:hypothetical protein [Bacterioplanoides sp.]|uniref:hypothetical protein n=1 Tax=Bacterioplanoides sp. TaxID=2066072 RepID=UPI003B5A2BCF